MTVRQGDLGHEVVVRFGSDLPIREAIELPKILKHRLAETVVLDFRAVRHIDDSAAAALIPALGSLRSKAVWTLGLDRLGPGMNRLGHFLG